MTPHSTADADATSGPDGAPDRDRFVRRPITLWIVVGVFALSGATYLFEVDPAAHAVGGSASVLTGIIMLVLAGGMWFGQKWAIVTAVVLQVIGLLLAFISVNFPAVVLSIVLIGTMFAIPRRVWH